MNAGIFKISVLAACVILAGAAIYFFKPERSRLTRITVVGDSQAKVAPDTALITFSVVTQGKQAIEAQQENARKSEAVKQAVNAAAGSAKIEIKTSDYALSPQQDNYSFQTPKILGYDVKNSITVSLNSLDLVGSVIDAATKAGANSVDGIKFVIGEASPAQGEALTMASQQAMAKAEAIAKALNGRIVRVIETSEGGTPETPRFIDTLAEAASNTAAKSMGYKTPVEAGQVNLRAQVVMVVEIAI